MTKQRKPKEISLERTLSEGEFRDVIAHAESLQRFDEVRKDERLYDSVLASLSSDEGYALSLVHQVAEGIGIPQEYVDRAISLRYPSTEEQIEDLERFGATQSVDLTRGIGNKKIKTFTNSLLRDLQSSYPGELFSLKQDGKIIKLFPGDYLFHNGIFDENNVVCYFKRILKGGRKILFFKYDKKDELAMIKFWFDKKSRIRDLDITLQDPIFLRACEERLEGTLEDVGSSGKLSVEYNYEIE